RSTIGCSASNWLILLLDQRIIALHQSRQSRVETEVAQILADTLDRLVAQTLDSFGLVGLFIAGILQPGIIDQAPGTVQEAPDAFQVIGFERATSIKGTNEHHVAAYCIGTIFLDILVWSFNI